MRVERGGAGLLVVQPHADGDKGDRAAKPLAGEPEEGYFAGLGGRLDDDGGEFGEQPHRFRQFAQSDLGFLVSLMDRCGGFEFEGFGCRRSFALQG